WYYRTARQADGNERRADGLCRRHGKVRRRADCQFLRRDRNPTRFQLARGCGLLDTSDKIRRFTGAFRSRNRQMPVRNSYDARVVRCAGEYVECPIDLSTLFAHADSTSDAAVSNITIRLGSGAELMRRESMYNDSLFNAFARSFEARSQSDMSMTE